MVAGLLSALRESVCRGIAPSCNQCLRILVLSVAPALLIQLGRVFRGKYTGQKTQTKTAAALPDLGRRGGLFGLF